MESNGEEWKKEGSEKPSPAVGNVGFDLQFQIEAFFNFPVRQADIQDGAGRALLCDKILTYSTPQLLYVKIK